MTQWAKRVQKPLQMPAQRWGSTSSKEIQHKDVPTPMWEQAAEGEWGVEEHRSKEEQLSVS